MKRTVLTPPGQGDTGAADDVLRAALAGGDERAAAIALGGSRVFVAVEARLLDADAATGADKASEMVLLTLQVPSGATAIPAFSSVDTFARWRPGARPVAVSGHALCIEAVRSGHAAVVLDIAGPAMATIDGDLLEGLAGPAARSRPRQEP